MNICLYGSSRDSILEQYKTGVFRLGSLIAQRGHGLVFGGGREGLMGLAAGGALSAGGQVTAIVPEFFIPRGVVMEGCTRRIVTKTMHERKALMERQSDAFIAVPGGIGTFEELCEIITWRQLGLHSKPIALYSPAGYYDGLMEVLEQTVQRQAMPRSTCDSFRAFDRPEAVLDYLEEESRRHVQ